MGDFDTAAILQFIALVIDIIWTNTLANRIRDYGSNPWISLFSLIPLVNVGLALYYGIVKYKKKPVSDSAVDTSDTSLAKAVYNHTKDIATEVKPTIDDYKQKHATSQNLVQNDDAIYEQVMLEIEEDRKVKSAWARALSQADGNSSKAEALYIQFRVKAIKDEKTNIDNKLLEQALPEQEQVSADNENYSYATKDIRVMSTSSVVAWTVIIIATLIIFATILDSVG